MSAEQQQPILIVEDDEVTAELERRALTRAGRTTRTVHRASDAIAALRTDAFGVVLLDYHLPDGDPWSVVDVAQACVPKVPVIVVTAQGNERIAAEALHHGVADYLQKTDTFWNQLPEVVDRVTQQARAEEQRRRSDTLFRLFAESATDLIATMDLAGVIQEVSAACATMLGYQREELIGRHSGEFVHPEDRERLAGVFSSKQTHRRLTYRHVKKDGSPLWVEANASVARDPATGRAREIVAIIRDVHERKRAEDRFRALLEGSPEANVIVDGDGRIVLVNARTEQLFGYPRDELLGHAFEILLTDRSRAQSGIPPLSALAGPLDISARRKDGSEFPAEISLNRLESEGELLISSTILDISDRKTLQDQHMLLRLGEQFSQFDEVPALVQHVVDELGQYFDVERCIFTEIDVERGQSIAHGEFRRSGPSRAGVYRIDDLTPGVRRELEAGRVLTISDLRSDLRTADTYAERFEPLGVRAMAAVPLMRKGRWAANVFVSAAHIRHWTAREIQMLQALVERTWLWIEHVRMVRALRDSERKYRHFIETTHEGVWEIDTETRTRFVNPRMAQLMGYAQHEMLGMRLIDFMDDEGRAILSQQVDRRKAGISEAHDSKFLRKDGTPIWLRLETNPLTDSTGEYIGALAMVSDVTERRQAEQDQQFLLTLSELLTIANEPSVARRAAVHQLGMHLGVQDCAFLEFDLARNLANVTDAWLADPSSRRIGTYSLQDSSTLPDLMKGRSAIINDTRTDPRTRTRWELRYQPLGLAAYMIIPMHKEGQLTAALMLAGAQPRTWTQREVSLAQATVERTSLCVERLQNIAALHDMSKELERRVEARTRELKAALREKEVLLKEIHHRVKNNLQVISSMLNLQAMHLHDDAVQQVFAESQGRVQSIALVHETLYESQDLSSVNFSEYIHTLVTTIMQAQATPDRNIATLIDAEGVRLPVGTAIPCGLIVNELVTNSLKHAFPNRSTGAIRVSLHNRPNSTIELIVGDDGVGLPADLDPRTVSSLGLDLVYTFAEQLGAAVDLRRSGGTEFRFEFHDR
ncbi:MAG TPA: PAS domain S-box protein, partial [Polyangiales bacterium]|nr:PAS domain S-box protein [Polyangiales bacterium]